MRITQSLACLLVALLAAHYPPFSPAQTLDMPLVATAVVLENLGPIELTSSSTAPEPTVVTASSKRRVDIDRDGILESRDRPGSLMLCGGGTLPRSILETFFALGRASQGTLVIIPSASSQADSGDYSPMLKTWQGFAWESIRVLHAHTRAEVEENNQFVQPLRRATAVWISGGDQSRLAERYLGTDVERELQHMIARGGVVGGSSAGAAIASRVMIAGGQKQPTLSSGFDLLPGAIIDQHFTQRKRFTRLASAVNQHPNRFGIGIDEGTCVIICQQYARVLGVGSAYLYSATSQPATSQPATSQPASDLRPMQFKAGSDFDLPVSIAE